MEVTENDLKAIFDSFMELENELKIETKKIFENESNKGQLFKSSHFIFSVVNRAVALNRGFLQLTNLNNYLAAISLIRLQVDNCLRLYAMSLVDNPSSFYDSVLEGIEIGNLCDRDGKKMTDNHLATKIDTIFPEFKKLYKNTCGFIHFSHEHLYFNNKVKDLTDDSFILSTSIGDIDKLEIYEKVDYSFNMLMAGKSLYKLIKEYRITMQKYLTEND
ncbi:MAG: hypothetical protein M1292_15415 [Bacteroidetes bacterium]|nr:hypothetical protein [Bacteroidota bacterium]